jgi:flavorubredoxin
MQIVDRYYEWSQDYNEGYAVIIYDTMYEATKAMADAIAEGLRNKGVKYKIFNAAVSDQSDLITEIFKAKAVLIGSCTVNNTVLRAIAGLLDEVRGHKFKGKVGAGFGSYGWSGEAPKIISRSLEESGLKVPEEPLMFKYRLTEDELVQCVAYGEKIAENI